jgi:hypothetical protein
MTSWYFASHKGAFALLRRDYPQKSAPPLLRLLGARSTGNTNVSRRHNDELAGRQLVRVLLHRLIQVLNLGLQLGPRKPEKQDARVRKALVENQLSEIAVGNDEDPLLLSGNRQHVLIRKTWRIIAGDGWNVVAEVSEVVDKAKVSALIKEKFHTSGASERAPLGGFGETSSPVTIALA